MTDYQGNAPLQIEGQVSNNMNLMVASKRLLFPRWRLFHNAKNFDEINHISNERHVEEEQIDYLNAVEEWKASNNLENAIELCASAIVHGQFYDAKEAALFILDTRSSSKSVIAMAEKALNPNQKIEEPKLDNHRACIANLRKKIHRSPINPILWLDIAFLYSTCGQNHKAERAIKNALVLAPHNRFIVRCAARFFIHVNKIPEARRCVEKYRFLKQDPWVLAVELSISLEQRKISKYLKLSKNAIEKKQISPFNSSELASTLGDMEMVYGSNKKAKKLFHHSLEDPTDNSVAQAQWVENRHKLGISLGDDITDYEAKYYKFHESGEWVEAMRSAEEWAKYEPYSTRSYAYMSYVALVCQDTPDKSIDHCKDGLELNTNSFLFLNNKTVAYAYKKKITKAKETFKLIKKQSMEEEQKPIYTATEGILAFRNNDVDRGRELYIKAIKQLNPKTQKNTTLINLVRLFWAREEIIAETEGAHEFFYEVKDKMKSEKDKGVLSFKENVEKLLVRQST